MYVLEKQHPNMPMSCTKGANPANMAPAVKMEPPDEATHGNYLEIRAVQV
jgi:hypothetical protein